MLKYYTVSHGFSGTVDFTAENLSECKTVLKYKNCGKDFRQKVFEALKKICTEVILKYGTDDDFSCIKTDKGAVVFEDDFNISPVFSEHLQNAKDIHDKWEEIYISEMDFEKLNKAFEFAKDILIGKNTAPGKGCDINRFFGTMTNRKNVNFIENLTDGIQKRIFIKGRPGSGKSTLMKKIRDGANNAGFDTETYHCSFDPKSLDMVIVRTLSVCIFDSTAPHEMFPQKGSDEILDLYSLAFPINTDLKHSLEIQKIKSRYDYEISQAKQYIPSYIDDEIVRYSDDEIFKIYDTLK